MSNVVEYEGVRKRAASPWTWVPTLYFLQALPLVMVTELSKLSLQKMGVPQLQFLAWIGLASLPWTLKLLWAPLIDLSAKKRTWVLILQPTMVALMLLVAAATSIGPGAFPLIISLLAVVAIASATHDIAADGYYLLSLSKEQQAKFVGVLTLCGRLAKLFCQFVLLYLVGVLIGKGFKAEGAWGIAFVVMAATFGVGTLIDFFVLKDVEPQPERRGGVGEHIKRTATVVLAGLVLYFVLAAAVRLVGHYWAPHLSQLAVTKWGQTEKALQVWQWVAIGCAVAVAPTFILAAKMLRGSEIGTAISTYVRQPRFGSILYFVITYRIGEAMLASMSYLFLQDSVANGGMGVDEKTLAGITGIAGLVGIILGGLLGGWFVSKVGLRRAFWPLAVVMHTPNLLFVYAAFTHPPEWQLYPIMFIDQFGYGFGFAAYFVYLMQVAQRTPEFRTTHYAIGTGMGALIVTTLAPALAAIIQSVYGYKGLFMGCCVATIPGMVALFLIPLDEKRPATGK